MGNEYYSPHVMAAGASTKVGPKIGAFLATVAGTMTITDSSGAVIVNALPIAVGFNRLALTLNYPTDNVVALTTAAGVLLL